MKNQIPFVVILGGLVFATACASTVSRNIGTPGLTPSKKPFIQNNSPVTSVQSEEPSGVISLDDALQAAP